jgi:hypothetical protein
MMPPIPAIIHLPNDQNDGYYPANVVAAIPAISIGRPAGSIYAVTAVNPLSSPDAPTFLTAEVSRSIHGFWHASEWAGPTDLPEALIGMTTQAGLL